METFIPKYWLKIEAKTAVLVGQIIMRWSLAEMALLMPMLLALRSDKQEIAAGILSSTNSTEGKIKIVKVAVENSVQPDVKRKLIIAALNRLEGLCPTRNAICHHIWATDSDGVSVTIDWRKREGHPERIVVRSKSSLCEFGNKVIETAIDISNSSDSELFTAESAIAYDLEDLK